MDKYDLRDKSTGELIDIFYQLATDNHDGHCTILAFTTNFRVGFGTPFSRDDYEKIRPWKTIEDALIYAILNEPTFD